MNLAKIGCSCGHSDMPKRAWRLTANPDIVHLEARCAGCGVFLKWLPQTPENLIGMGPKPGANTVTQAPTVERRSFSFTIGGDYQSKREAVEEVEEGQSRTCPGCGSPVCHKCGQAVCEGCYDASSRCDCEPRFRPFCPGCGCVIGGDGGNTSHDWIDCSVAAALRGRS